MAKRPISVTDEARLYALAVGATIRFLRNAIDATQDEIADRSGLPQFAVSRLERADVGRVYLYELRAVAGALNSDLSTVIFIVEETFQSALLKKHAVLRAAALGTVGAFALVPLVEQARGR